MSRKSQLKKSGLLFLAAFIWGTAFVAQSAGIKEIDAFTFNGIRFFLGAIVLLPVIWFIDRSKKHENGRKNTEEMQEGNKGGSKMLWLGGLVCGILLCAGTNLQQMGIKYTTAGKAGFITAFYIVLVPVFGIFLKKKCPAIVWLSVALALIGLGLLCVKEDLSVGKGEALVFVCAIVFAFHILAIDYFVNYADGVKMSCIQFAVSGVISSVLMLIFEKPELHAIKAAWLPIAYTGIMSCGVAYTLQVIGQKGMNPTVASIILSLESVVSVLAGWVILKQGLNINEKAGCILMFVAIILTEVPLGKKEQHNQKV